MPNAEHVGYGVVVGAEIRRRPDGTDRYSRPAKQQRSRASFERAVDAAVALLVARRSDTFTLNEVAERAGVSIGSIYGRVNSKDDLLRVAHAREIARIGAEQATAFRSFEPAQDETLARTVAKTVATLADLLRDNASVLAAFMVLANHDSTVGALGKASHDEMVGDFCRAILTCRERITHPDPERAVKWACTVSYSVLARWLGLGSEQEAAGEGDWELILADLSEMVTAFLRPGGGDTAADGDRHGRPSRTTVPRHPQIPV